MDAVNALRVAVEKAGSQKQFAEAHGLSQAYISDVLAGRRDPGAAILKALSLTKRVVYERKKSDAPEAAQ